MLCDCRKNESENSDSQGRIVPAEKPLISEIQRAQTNISFIKFAHASVIFSLITVQRRNTIDEVKVQKNILQENA